MITLLVAIVICVGSYTTTQLVSAVSDGNIHGTVVDANGDPIYDAKVSAVTRTGYVEATKYTKEDGYFRMSLGGSYTLVFEKTGYATTEVDVEVTTAPSTKPDYDVILTDVMMEYTLKLTASVVKRITSPGNTLLLSFTVNNLNDETELVVFLVDAPEGWGTRVLDSLGKIESISLSPGVESYTLEVKVPSTASQTETITLMASGTSEASLGFTITPMASANEIELRSTYPSVSEELGQRIELPLRVSNVGEVTKLITFQTEAPSGWDVSYKTSSGIVVKSLSLSSDETESLTIELEHPEDAVVGDYSIAVQAVDTNDNVCDTLIFEVNLRQPKSELEVISTFSDVTVEAGDSITFPIVVWNTGEKDAVCLLTVLSAPDNWNTEFITGDIAVSNLLIGAGESITFDIEVEPPKSVATGNYELQVVVASDDGSHTVLPFGISVSGSYELTLELSTLYTSVTIGGTVTYTARVTNNGQTAITTLYLEATLPSDWEATITPVQVNSLSPRESTTFTVVTETPSDAVAGDYLLTMKATSDQLDSDEIDLRVTAKASTSWGLIGLGVAAVAIVGAVFAFRKFKRR
ncbi:carboxypeptidase regulatory-like domain-containing protein [Candidatus Bathyarchaeota archaeon]|nr:carboxypeptidase regulatory-like domain-containing protein [Candidatus Bathyarchaeota archaeon]